MKGIGGFMFFMGVGSSVLYFLDREFILLSWVSMWGETTAWIIRGLLAVVGGILWLIGQNSEA